MTSINFARALFMVFFCIVLFRLSSGYNVAEVPSGQRHWAWGPCEKAKPDCNTFCIKLGINPRFGGYCKVNEVGINLCYCRV
ncbi:hypothetical protein ACFX2J_042270 [Malus domestica]